MTLFSPFKRKLAIESTLTSTSFTNLKADQSCYRSKRPQEEQNHDGDGFGSHFEDIELGEFGAISR